MPDRPIDASIRDAVLRSRRPCLTAAARSLTLLGLGFVLAAAGPAAAHGQGTDTTGGRPSPSLVVPKPAGAPPITPRRAFLYSLAMPGTGQSILSRPTAGAIFVAAEAGTLAMIAKSVDDLRAARAIANDSVITSYAIPPGGTIPIAIRSATPGALRARSRIPARRAHVEDWITLLIVNHFLSGADAYVAANLWDVPIDVTAEIPVDGRVQLGARVAW